MQEKRKLLKKMVENELIRKKKLFSPKNCLTP